MLSPIAGQAVLAIYAVLLAVGGIIGYVKAGSKPSLIAGLASALLSLIALGVSIASPTWGMAIGAVLAALLAAFFGRRYLVTTRKFMPAGLLAAVSLIVLATAILVLVLV
jgi:uncharacterized membrane protein (UPF0136 family)